MMRRERMGMYLSTIACAILWGASPEARADGGDSSADAVSSCADGLDLIVLAPHKAVRVQIRAELDHHSVSSLWGDAAAFQRLLSYYDRNDDGILDREEGARLPSPFAVRQQLWRPIAPFTGPGPAFESLDLNDDGKVVLSELADCYRRGGLGNITVAVGRPPSTAALTTALVNQLDVDGNGRADEQEWQNAALLLRKSDADGDELIGPGDLLAGVAYPGAMGAVLVSAPTAAVSSKAIDGSVPAIVLPTRLADTQWATFLVRQQDRDGNGRLDTQELSISADSRSLLDGDNDGQLTADELAGWRRLKADLVCRVRLDDGQSTTALIEHATNVSVAADNQDDVCLSVEPLQFVLRPAEGALGKLIPLRKKRYETRFTDADTNQDGALTVDEVSKRDLSELKYLLNSADRDGNGQLSKLELSAWLDLQEQLARGHILLTLYDYGTGLFEFLDADHNGGLSARELRIAWQRVREAGCIQEGAFDATALPHLCLASISRGHPLSAVALPRRDGPTWFLSMDRNSDGDVSAREFLGSSAEFRMLDTDGDGLLSANEARLGDISRSASAK